jgi:Integrase zinc binding domain
LTLLQDSSFPATTFNIKQSQDTLPVLINKLATSTLYTKIQREGIDIICRNGKIVLGPPLFTDILAWYHVNLNHPGQDRTYKTLHTVFYVPNMEA